MHISSQKQKFLQKKNYNLQTDMCQFFKSLFGLMDEESVKTELKKLREDLISQNEERLLEEKWKRSEQRDQIDILRTRIRDLERRQNGTFIFKIIVLNNNSSLPSCPETTSSPTIDSWSTHSPTSTPRPIHRRAYSTNAATGIQPGYNTDSSCQTAYNRGRHSS